MNTRSLNIRHLVLGAAVALAAPLAAHAASPAVDIYQGGEAAYTEFPVLPSTKTRAEVHAEVLQARRDGTLDAMQQSQTPPNRLLPVERKTREEVISEMRNEPAEQRAAREQLMDGA